MSVGSAFNVEVVSEESAYVLKNFFVKPATGSENISIASNLNFSIVSSTTRYPQADQADSNIVVDKTENNTWYADDSIVGYEGKGPLCIQGADPDTSIYCS